MEATKTRVRDAEATKSRILKAAKQEFAKLGLGGARVDVIAECADANKRMIYHYFGSKEELFKAVLEDAYLDIRAAERSLELDQLPPRQALETLVRFTWQYYLDNPEFVRLVNSENLHQARHLKSSERTKLSTRGIVGAVQNILQRGQAEGTFRPNIDPVQLNITIAALGFYYLNNRWTGSFLFERDFMSPQALDARLNHNIDTIMRLVAKEQ